MVGDQTCFDFESSVHVADAEMQFSAVYWLDGTRLVGGLTQTDVLLIPKRPETPNREAELNRIAKSVAALQRRD